MKVPAPATARLGAVLATLAAFTLVVRHGPPVGAQPITVPSTDVATTPAPTAPAPSTTATTAPTAVSSTSTTAKTAPPPSRRHATTTTTTTRPTTTIFAIPGRPADDAGPPPTTGPLMPVRPPSGDLPGWSVALFWVGVGGAAAVMAITWIRNRRRPVGHG